MLDGNNNLQFIDQFKFMYKAAWRFVEHKQNGGMRKALIQTWNLNVAAAALIQKLQASQGQLAAARSSIPGIGRIFQPKRLREVQTNFAGATTTAMAGFSFPPVASVLGCCHALWRAGKCSFAKGVRIHTSIKRSESTRTIKLPGKRSIMGSGRRNQIRFVVLREEIWRFHNRSEHFHSNLLVIVSDIWKETHVSLDIDSQTSPSVLQIIFRNQHFRKIAISGNAKTALHHYPPHSVHLSTRPCASLI